MIRYTGRAKEIVTIPGKPTPTGFKVWALAQAGYLFSWCYHAYSKGPQADQKPPKLPGLGEKPLTNCQAVVVYLTQLLPKPQQLPDQQPRFYHLWLDNLFTSINLLRYLRSISVAATGTTRTNSGICKTLIELKSQDKKKDYLPWNHFVEIPDPSGQVNQLAWKDQNLVCILLPPPLHQTW